MKRDIGKNPGGRPFTPIDKEQFEQLCALQCTAVEIANFFHCSHDTITNFCKEQYGGKTFAEAFAELRSPGLTSLRRNQFAMAEKNVAMAIWLGKQYLGQKDNIGVSGNLTVEDDPLTKAIKDGF